VIRSDCEMFCRELDARSHASLLSAVVMRRAGVQATTFHILTLLSHSPLRRFAKPPQTLVINTRPDLRRNVLQRHLQPRMYAAFATSHHSNQLMRLLAQPTTWRRQDDPEYADDPEFNRYTTELSDKLFSLTSNIGRLASQIALLGTRRETDRVRERVQDLLQETGDGFKDVGEGLKKVQAWHDLGVGLRTSVVGEAG